MSEAYLVSVYARCSAYAVVYADSREEAETLAAERINDRTLTVTSLFEVDSIVVKMREGELLPDE